MSEKKSITSRFNDFKRQHFPERQLFLRSEGRVRFVTFGTHTQMAIAFLILIAVSWGAVSTVAYVTRAALLEEKDNHIANISGQYKELSGDFSQLESEIEKRARALEQRQKLIEEMAGIEEITTPDAEKIEAKPDPKPEPAHDKTSQSLSLSRLLGGGAAYASDPTDSLFIDPKARRIALLERLDRLENRQRTTVQTMITNMQGHMDQIDTILSGTKLKVATLIKQADHKANTAQGGPFELDPTMALLKGSRDEALFDLLLETHAKADYVNSLMASLPIGEPAAKYYISSKFGRRKDPFKKVWATHSALDMAGWPGTKIMAAASGTVYHARYRGAYGRMIEIDHGNGFRTRYGHMRKLRVKEGQQVTAGQHIGDMGQTGRSTSTHLHYEVWFNGQVRDPLPYLKAAENVRKIKQKSAINPAAGGSANKAGG